MKAKAIGRKLPNRKEELGRLMQRYGSLLSLASLSLGGIVQLSPGAAIEKLGKGFSNVELDELSDRIGDMLRNERVRIVALIDDIDRLDRGEIQAIFKLVKLSAGFDYTSYVLAFDDEVVAGSLGERYGQGGAEAGRSFLEKIVQVPLGLPPADSNSLRDLTFEGVNEALAVSGIELSQEQVDAFVTPFIFGTRPRLKTPRQARLYVNALMFALPILRGEVHPVDQMLLESIHIFYPRLYSTIRDHPDYVLKEQREGYDNQQFVNQVKNAIGEALNGLTETERSEIQRHLLEVLFPRLQDIFGNMHYGSEWEKDWEKEQRICSQRYFPRYFSYGIAYGDVSDRTVTEFLDTLKAECDQNLDNIFASIAENKAIAALIQKLRLREDEVDARSGKRLALAISRNCKLIPRDRGPLVSDLSLMQAAILLRNIIRKVDNPSERIQLARDIIGSAQTLRFAFEFLRRIRKDEDEAEEKRPFAAKHENDIGKLLASRIRDAAANQPPYKEHGKDAPSLMYAWNKYGKRGEISAYLRDRFAKVPTEIEEFLETYVGEAWGLDRGMPHRAKFHSTNYDDVASIIEPNFILAKLRKHYGAELDNPQYHPERGVVLCSKIAHEFAYVHKAASDDSATSASTNGDDE